MNCGLIERCSFAIKLHHPGMTPVIMSSMTEGKFSLTLLYNNKNLLPLKMNKIIFGCRLSPISLSLLIEEKRLHQYYRI